MLPGSDDAQLGQLLGAFVGVVVAAASPAWLILLAELPDVRRERRAAFVGFVIAVAVVTAALGLGWLLLMTGQQSVQQGRLLRLGGALAVGGAVVEPFAYRSRRGRVRTRVWRAEHPDEDAPPTTRRQRRLAAELDQVVTWHIAALTSCSAAIDRRGWISARDIASAEERRPRTALLTARHGASATQDFVASRSPDTRAALSAHRAGLAPDAHRLHAAYLADRAERDAHFFASVERSPLTDEQIRAVVCFDDRLRLVAAAGSGKTSTIVAKAGFAIRSGLVEAERMLVLSFNSDAADEVQRRMNERLGAAGVSTRVQASTFHAYGSQVLGRATGRKRRIAPWIDQRREVEQLADIVRQLQGEDAAFARRWALFQAVYADFLPARFGEQETRLTTRSGLRVKSAGERMIADWLWYHQVTFEYEPPYIVDTADAEHSQYRPDFHYPQAELWHEHFAFDEHGEAPDEFEGYAEEAEWKRAQHRRHGTMLLETTTAELGDGTALGKLERALRAAGVALTPRTAPATPSAGRIADESLLQLFLRALPLVKGRDLDEQALRDAAATVSGTGQRQRALVFFELLGPVLLEWNRRLEACDAIDYDDMILGAAEALENGAAEAPFDLVMVDEFQDLSGPRARLLHAILNRSGARLFAVGDDWQTINGYAGADVGEFLQFHERYGEGSTLRLERTFRSSQAICDVAGAFVAANPAQLPKDVRSLEVVVPQAVRIRVLQQREQQTAALRAHLDGLQARITRSRAAGRPEPDRTVRVLGRYRSCGALVPEGRWPALRITYSTVHGAKGLEADYVVVLDLLEGFDGFPSTRVDDPILAGLHPPAEAFVHAEERRLLYVALTRARRAALLLSVEGRLSPFVPELARLDGVRLEDGDGRVLQPCPSCTQGLVVERSGAHGPFVTCSTGRRCSFRRDAPARRSSTRASRAH